MSSLHQAISRIGQIQKVFSSWSSTHTPTSQKLDSSIPSSSLQSSEKALSVDSKPFDFLNSSTEPNSYSFEDLVAEASQKYELPDTLIKSVIQVESNFNHNAISPKGAMGLMQLMPDTAKQYQVKKPYSPKENINAGSNHLRNLLNRYDGNLIKALAAYNAGENSFEKNSIPNYRETQNYVKKVIDNYMKYNGVDL